MSSMKKRITSGIATVICSVMWVATVTAIPFVEEYFAPSGPNDSWQRGVIYTPILLFPALFVFHFITRKVTQAGYVTYLAFIGKSSIYGYLIFISFAAPVFIAALVIEMMPVHILISISAYMGALAYLIQLPSLSVWWLITSISCSK